MCGPHQHQMTTYGAETLHARISRHAGFDFHSPEAPNHTKTLVFDTFSEFSFNLFLTFSKGHVGDSFCFLSSSSSRVPILLKKGGRR